MDKSRYNDVVEQLDQFYLQAKRQILQNQSAITGLFPANSAETSSASIKTSLWAASSIFALYLAYSKRVDNDKGKAHDLGQSVVKCMRGILFAWMRQSEKVEAFKANQSPKHALHLKFDLHSGLANDNDYPHLQIDVVSLYLIFLANFIASGLDIIYCMDEVTFIQNLVYYVERAYRTPDFGGWEPSYEPSGPQQAHTIAPPAPDAHVQLATTIHTHAPSYSGYAPRPAHGEPINYHVDGPRAYGGSSQPAYMSSRGQHNGGSVGHGVQNQACQSGQSETNDWSRTDGRSLEIHATSIGMAKSALEAINGCNLFGGKGANWSIIYSDIDAHSRNRSIFETLLPRESRSKNTDSYLLATISWPCFATHDPQLYQGTKAKILRRLKGKYGFKRFLRDSYGTVLESTAACPRQDSTGASSSGLHQANCLHSQQAGPSSDSGQSIREREWSFNSTTSTNSLKLVVGEPPKSKQRKSSYFQRKNGPDLRAHYHESQSPQGNKLLRTDSATKMSKRFEHIESEWPLYVCFLIIDGIFKQDMEQVYENEKLLYERLLRFDPANQDYLMPKYYYVPRELINSEKCCPDSVIRLPSAEGSSTDKIYLTGQSILLITRLLLANLVHPNELDPLRRHMPSHDRPKTIGRYSSFQATSSDLVVQTVLIAESIRLQALMANYGIQTQTAHEVEPVKILSSSQLVKVYEYLGVNEKLSLKGRPSRPIGALGTSKLYRILGQTILCYPLIFEVSDFYLAQDMLLLIDDIQNELNFIGRYWRMSGRPTVCIMIREEHLRDLHFRDLLDLLVQFKNGRLKKSGLRIKTGRLQNLISSSCIEHLDFLHLLPQEHLPELRSVVQANELHYAPLSKQCSLEPAASHQFQQQPPHQPALSEDQQATPLARTRRHLCSQSAQNLCTIEEQQQAGAEPSAGGWRPELELHCALGQLSGGQNKLSASSSSDLSVYSAPKCDSIDYYECYRSAPTWPTIVELLRSFEGQLAGQSQLLAILREREGAEFMLDDMSVERRLEEVSQLACESRNWSVVRYCSAVMKRSVESLSPWLTSILVNGKQISLGSAANEQIINNPLTPTEIHQLIYSTIKTERPCDTVLQQEIALYIGRLISTRPDYFEGILTIRVTNFMSAMRSYLNIKTAERRISLARQKHAESEGTQELANGNNQQLLDLRIKPEAQSHESSQRAPNFSPAPDDDDKHQHQHQHQKTGRKPGRGRRSNHELVARTLESLSPSEVRKLLVNVLDDDQSLPISDRRQITGELCRVPKDFYDNVWLLLGCTSIGIVIGGKLLRSVPTLTNMTQDDLNFALKVESMLSEIECPKLRQVNVELLMTLHVILERNPEIKFESDPLDLGKIIELSLDKFRLDFERKDFGLDEYYTHPVQTTMLYTVRTVFDCLLPAKHKSDCKLS